MVDLLSQLLNLVFYGMSSVKTTYLIGKVRICAAVRFLLTFDTIARHIKSVALDIVLLYKSRFCK